MGKAVKEILDFIRPPEDATAKQVNRWRWNVCLTLLVLVGSVGWLYKSVAWAESVEKKIAAAIEPIAKEQHAQGAKIDTVTRLLTEQLAATVAAQIRLTISKRCKATAFADREELNREKDRLQAQYREYKGELYVEPGCADL
jgi:hypothetical protein